MTQQEKLQAFMEKRAKQNAIKEMDALKELGVKVSKACYKQENIDSFFNGFDGSENLSESVSSYILLHN